MLVAWGFKRSAGEQERLSGEEEGTPVASDVGVAGARPGGKCHCARASRGVQQKAAEAPHVNSGHTDIQANHLQRECFCR